MAWDSDDLDLRQKCLNFLFIRNSSRDIFSSSVTNYIAKGLKEKIKEPQRKDKIIFKTTPAKSLENIVEKWSFTRKFSKKLEKLLQTPCKSKPSSKIWSSNRKQANSYSSSWKKVERLILHWIPMVKQTAKELMRTQNEQRFRKSVQAQVL